MLDLVSDIWSCQIAEQTLEVISDLDLIFIFPPVFPFDKVLVQVIDKEWLNEARIFLLLVVSCRFSRIHKDWRGQRGRQYFWWFVVIVVNIEHEQQIELDTYI